MKTKQKSLNEGTNKQTTTTIHSSACSHHIGDTVDGSSTNSIIEANGTLATVPPEVAKIRQLYGELMDAARRTVLQAIHIGELLAGLKKKVGHGQWEAFVAEHLKLEIRTVQNYMRLHREKDRLKYETVSDLPLAKAYLVLREPTSTSPSRKPRTVQKPASPAPDQEGGTEPNSPPESRPAQDLAMDATTPGEEKPHGTQTSDAGAVEEAPAVDLPAATTVGNPQPTAGQFIYNSAQAPVLIVDGWRDGLISEQQVREDVTSLDGNAKGDSPHDVAETQRLVVQLAGFVNGVVPANANAATLSNLCDAAKRLNTIALTLLLKKTPRQTPGSSTVHRQSNITHQPK